MLALLPKQGGLIDLENAGGVLATDNSLLTAVIVSLLTDRRAEPDDRLPIEPGPASPLPPDRRGWTGDALNPLGRRVGSRLWLLAREKQLPETMRRAEEYAREALQWLVDDGHALSIRVSGEWQGIGRLNLYIEMDLPQGGMFSEKVEYAL